jgi:beta-phosphoglucomutase
MNRKNNYYKDSLEFLSPNNILDGSKQLIKYLKSNGKMVAIGSSSKNAKSILKKLEIEHEFDAIIDGTQITHSKPDPEIFLKAADKIGIKYENCAVVEDAPAGVEAAQKAGMFSIGIGSDDRFYNLKVPPDMHFKDLKAFYTYLSSG